MPISAANNGTSGSVTRMITAASTSWVRMTTITVAGTTAAVVTAGRYRAK
jgi:hypothetical protein